MKIRREKIINDALAYYAGGDLDDGYSDEGRDIIAASIREWEALPCDPEGATKEQESAMDEHLELLADEVLALC